MTEFEDELRAVLHRAAGRLDATAPPWSVVATDAGIGAPSRGRAWRWWPRPRLGSLTAAFGVAVAIVVAVVALTTLHSGGSGMQSGGSPPVVTPPRSPLASVSQREQNEIFRYLTSAEGQIWRHTRSCRPGAFLSDGGVKASDGRPPPQLLKAFAVLRRPAALPARDAARLLAHGLIHYLGPYIRDVQFVEVRYGISYYVVPVKRGPGGARSARCDRLELAVTTHELRHASAGTRAALLHLASRYLDYERRVAGTGPAVCLLGAGGCVRPTQLLDTGAQVGTGGRGDSRRTTVTALVPDGPYSITLDIPGGSRTPHGEKPPPISITLPVIDNVAVTTLPIAYAELAISPTRILWRAKDGRVIKIFESGG